MAIYHFSVSHIGRAKGYMAVAAAAYRSGEKLEDDYYGRVHDYTRKKGILHTEISLPEGAPERYKDRKILWNAVEFCEKHPRADLAYSFDMALPKELTVEENTELMREFVETCLTSRGMICDWAIHLPHGKKSETQRPLVLCLLRKKSRIMA